MRVGVLALQGDHAAHEAALQRAVSACGLRCEVSEVRRAHELRGLSGLVLPGGESTALLKLMEPEQLGLAIARFALEEGGAILATCAGAILISREVTNPGQASLGLLDAVIERNAYGRQADSFIASLKPEPGTPLGDEPLEAVFIRAPRFASVGPRVEILVREGESPALVRQGRLLAATFHPEMTPDPRVHSLFLRMVAGH